MPNLFMPFNFKPVSVITTTGSYTVPSDKYVFLTAVSYSNNNLIINGTAAMQTTTGDVIEGWRTVFAGNTFGTGYSIPQGVKADLILRSAAGTILLATPDGTQFESVVGTVVGGYLVLDIPAGPRTVIYINGGPAQDVEVHFIATNYVSNTSASFWLPPDTEITGDALKTISIFQIP